MFTKLMYLALACVFLMLAGCVYYEEGYHQRGHDGYEAERCYDTEYGRRCRYGGGEDDQGEDEQN